MIKKHRPNKCCSHRFDNDQWNVVNELIFRMVDFLFLSFILLCLWVRWVDWNTFKFLMGSLLMVLKYASIEATHMHLSPFFSSLFQFFTILHFVFYTRSLPLQPTLILLHIFNRSRNICVVFCSMLSHPVGTRRMNLMSGVVVVLSFFRHLTSGAHLFMLRMWNIFGTDHRRS